MTNTQSTSRHSTSPDTTTSTIGVDARPHFATAVALAGEVIARVDDAQAHLPTVCDQFDVRGMTGHLMGVLQRTAHIGRGDSPFLAPDVVEDVPEGGWVAGWAAGAAETMDVWSDDACLTRTVQVPWTQLPGWVALTIYVNEITVHTWDLATATGQQPDWDADVIAVSLDAMRQAIPADTRIEVFEEAFAHLPEGVEYSYPFGAAVEVADDAAPIAALVAYNGRRP